MKHLDCYQVACANICLPNTKTACPPAFQFLVHILTVEGLRGLCHQARNVRTDHVKSFTWHSALSPGTEAQLPGAPIRDLESFSLS